MPTTVRPRGPLPARVYWTRRLVVLGIPLVLVVVLARILGGSSDATEAAGEKATRTGASVAPTPAPSAGPTAGAGTGKKNKGRKNKGDQGQQQGTAPPEPVLAEPSGPCDASDIVATPAVTQVAGGQDIPLTFNLRTVVTEACTFQASAQTMTVTITSGSDFIWSSQQCPDSIPLQDVVVRNAVEVPVTLTWAEGKRSDETCSGRTDWARPGFYHVESAALGGEGTDVQFELVAPQPGVVTQTADPQTQGGTGKKGDRSHTPGQDGTGNSEG
ncbi:hypothetical protein SAMN04489844_2036 [Nocardioides exalbidus]|uniref:Uncharacterized protein n=1 Tax=Nocardioides exalbidus TaxID=402596 RepID=A0A1H4RDG3_9ACTN|nr:hypothetical protein [Nocardioides exalbidus]SEC29848.1 hypothetical protein SAMN04489844_2036 [Nocardioides exalbidus]